MKNALAQKLKSWVTRTVEKTAPIVKKEVKKVVSNTATETKDNIMSVIPVIVMIISLYGNKKIKDFIIPANNYISDIPRVTFVHNEFHNTYNIYKK